MRLEWLEDILAVADTGSFSAAAEARFLTASAFTRRIKSIEAALGCELFDRGKKPVVLHRHALDSIDQMRDAVSTLKRLKVQLSQADADSQQQVSLICQHVLTTTLAPQIVELAARDQQLSVRIRSGTKNDCLLSLVKREVDFAMSYESLGETAEPTTDPDNRLFLGRDRFIPVAALASKPELEQLLKEHTIPTIDYPPSLYLGQIQRREITSYIDPAYRLVTVAETGLVLAIAEFVKRGLGVGWLPESLVTRELASGELSNLENTLPSCELHVYLSRQNGVLPDSAKNCWDLMKSHFADAVANKSREK